MADKKALEKKCLAVIETIRQLVARQLKDRVEAKAFYDNLLTEMRMYAYVYSPDRPAESESSEKYCDRYLSNAQQLLADFAKHPQTTDFHMRQIGKFLSARNTELQAKFSDRLG